MYPFTEGSFAVRNGWYVAAFAQDVQRALISRWILNEPVVLYRTEAGEAVAVAGRCPHRHFPLGQSQLSGDEIICGYHGITFGPDGLCTRVPSQQTVPGVYKIRKYPLVERGLWLWIWPGDPALADESLLPDLQDAGFHDPRFRFQPYYTHEIAGRYQLLNDNLLDLTPLAVLHRSSIGVAENASIPEEREETPRRCAVVAACAAWSRRRAASLSRVTRVWWIGLPAWISTCLAFMPAWMIRMCRWITRRAAVRRCDWPACSTP